MFGAEVSARVAKIVKDYDLNVHISQVGLASVPPPSLNDPFSLMEHARTFTSKIKETQETKPYRAHLRSFDNTPAFAVALAKAQLQELVNFDGSIRTMEKIVESYDLANERARLVTAALSTPSAFKSFKVEELTPYSKPISDKVSALKALALACAAKARAGEVCNEPTVAEMIVPPLPMHLARNPICASASTDKEGCIRVSSVDGECRCIGCDSVRKCSNSLRARLSLEPAVTCRLERK
jgi:hypothetical protein